jgi:hypothetical protein
MEETRDEIQNWLMNEGWQIAEQPHPDVEWLIRAEDADEHQKMFETLAADRRREILWNWRLWACAGHYNFHGLMMGMLAGVKSLSFLVASVKLCV